MSPTHKAFRAKQTDKPSSKYKNYKNITRIANMNMKSTSLIFINLANDKFNRKLNKL